MSQDVAATVLVNLLRSHGSPTGYLYTKGCRCTFCRAAQADRDRRYNETHREGVAERRRLYCAAHLEERAEYQRRWRAAHPSEDAEYRRRWSEVHPGAMRVRNRNHKAGRLAAPGTHTTADERAQYKRQKGKCFWCLEKVGDSYHVDHVTPLAKGGSNGPENLVIACPSCNLKKHTTHPMDFAGVML